MSQGEFLKNPLYSSSKTNKCWLLCVRWRHFCISAKKIQVKSTLRHKPRQLCSYLQALTHIWHSVGVYIRALLEFSGMSTRVQYFGCKHGGLDSICVVISVFVVVSTNSFNCGEMRSGWDEWGARGLRGLQKFNSMNYFLFFRVTLTSLLCWHAAFIYVV